MQWKNYLYSFMGCVLCEYNQCSMRQWHGSYMAYFCFPQLFFLFFFSSHNHIKVSCVCNCFLFHLYSIHLIRFEKCALKWKSSRSFKIWSYYMQKCKKKGNSYRNRIKSDLKIQWFSCDFPLFYFFNFVRVVFVLLLKNKWKLSKAKL